MAVAPTEQTNIVANKSRHLIFFEGSNAVAYNYKTQQWTKVPAYDDLGMFSVNSNSASIGLVRFSSGSVDLQTQTTAGVAQSATLTTGANDVNQGGRVVVNGVRPRFNGGTWTVRVGSQDTIDAAVTWGTTTALNSRTEYANMRVEGRFVRAELTCTDGFTTLMGADVQFSPQGRV